MASKSLKSPERLRGLKVAYFVEENRLSSATAELGKPKRKPKQQKVGAMFEHGKKMLNAAC
eukprot:4147695-Amphidinium_carterae.1